MKKNEGPRLSRAYLWLTTPRRDYALIDSVIVAYCGSVLLVQILLQISPFVTFLATTPFYSIQTYLGLLGGALIVVDLFTTKRIWQGKYSLFLYGILALAALASVRMISYGMKENIFKLCWMSIQFVLMYSCAYRRDRKTLIKYAKGLFYVLLLIWFVGCCVSLYQYVEQIGYMYVVNPLAMDSSSNRQGFYDNRLFGIFYTLNHAAYISLFFLVIAVVCTFREKSLWAKLGLLVAELALLCHIILSVSRSAMISMVICAAVLTWAMVRNAVKGHRPACVLIPLGAAVLAAVLCFTGYHVLKEGLARIPYLKSMVEYHQQADDPTAPSDPLPEPDFDDELLDRENLESDVSNGRMSIWKDYVSLYQQIGIIGLSPGNYMPYILEDHPELYIVDYIRLNYPDKYESGIIHHVHSGYMMIYVSTGILGLLCLIGFVVLCVIRLLRTILRNKSLSYLYICALALVTSGAFAALTDEGLFFQNNPHTTMFWLALGILMLDSLAPATLPESSNE
ncbi:MAG: O-antigen ligase family protein [Oscillospiraceae bacterium]|nr:O-antigen ligase family protein [Oscillospiraceae bacterium]